MKVLARFRSNSNLVVLVFEETGKPEYPEKKPLEARPRTNNTQPTSCYIVGVLSPLQNPWSDVTKIRNGERKTGK